VSPTSRSLADELLDELLPEELDWQDLVRRYPRSCLLAAGAAGVWLGYRRGRTLLGTFGALAAGRLAGTVGEILGGD
jgi:hypothetical protein